MRESDDAIAAAIACELANGGHVFKPLMTDIGAICIHCNFLCDCVGCVSGRAAVLRRKALNA